MTVDEGNLRFQVTCLRKAFGKEQIISTVKGRGYCFVAPFSRASDGDSATAGEEDVARAAHARHYGGFFDRLYDDFETMSRSEWTRVGRPEIDNFRAALSWALDRPERREFAISLVGAGGRLMLKLGLIGEGRRYGEQLLDAVGPDVPLDIAARFLRQSGALWVTSDYALALPLLARSVSLYRQLGDRRSHAGVMTMIGYIETAKGEYEAARNTLEEAWQILEQFDAKKELYSTTLNLGILCSRMDRMEEARTYFAKALEIARAIEDHDSESLTLLNLADLECG
ncbi:MAG: tetratricopeptide repeat protein [Aliidongia sp.]